MRAGSYLHEEGPEVEEKWLLIHYELDKSHALMGLSPGTYFQNFIQTLRYRKILYITKLANTRFIEYQLN
jgi:hypothetical protein